MNWPKKTRNHGNFTVLVIVSIFFVPILQQSTFGNHGKEIDLKFSDAQFLTLPGKNLHQLSSLLLILFLTLTRLASKLMESWNIYR